MAWTDEQKARVIELYTEGNPTPETSPELVKQIADEFEGATANGIRMLLVQAGVYVKKDATTAPTKTTKGGSADADKPVRVSKEDSINTLKAAIQAKGANVDDEILSKLTGKAAVYFTQVLKA